MQASSVKQLLNDARGMRGAKKKLAREMKTAVVLIGTLTLCARDVRMQNEYGFNSCLDFRSTS